MCDNVFADDDVTDNIDFLPENNEWKRIQESRLQDGYRDGIEKGENDRLQEGFNAGFKVTGPAAYQLAHLRGTVSAWIGMDAMNEEKLLEASVKTELEVLLEKILALERQLSEGKGTDILPESEESGVRRPGHVDMSSPDSEACCGQGAATSGSSCDVSACCCRDKKCGQTFLETGTFDQRMRALETDFKRIMESGTVTS